MRVKLSDITHYSKGSQINREDLIDNGEYIYLNGGINPSGRWTASNVDANTITISEGGNSSGYINYITEPFWCGAHCYYLFDGPKNTKYLYYALKSQQERLFAIRSGACMPNIKKADLGKFEFEFDYDEKKQDEIVSVLSSTENIINNRKKELEKLDELIRARFIEMFGDPLKNNKELPTVSGESLFKLSNGKTLPNSKRFTEGIPAYGGNGISWYTDEILCDYDTIIVGRVGFQSGNVHLAKAPLWVTDNAMYISNINNQKCDIRYLCALMEHIDFTRYQDAGDLKKITQKPFMQMLYLMPPIPLQKQYIDFVEQVDKSKFQKYNATILSHNIYVFETRRRFICKPTLII